MSSVVVERLVREQRRDRELALAYRIASARMRSARDARALAASERACAELAQRLAAITGQTAPAECHRSWARVGALGDEIAVLRALATLEKTCEEDLLRARAAATEREAPLLDEALAVHRDRRAWLEHRTGELGAV